MTPDQQAQYMAEWEAWQQYYWQQEQQQQQQQQHYLHEQTLHQQHMAHMEQQALSMMYQGATLQGPQGGGYGHLNYEAGVQGAPGQITCSSRSNAS